MSQSEEPKKAKVTQGATHDAREPYERPTLECEELYEVLALTCGKVQPRTSACRIAANQS